MRGLRRINGDARFSANNDKSDLEVRTVLNVASLDCRMMTARLQYLGRLVRRQPPTLLALLHFRCSRMGRSLPWMQLIRRDLEFISKGGWLPPRFGSFDDDVSSWLSSLQSELAWDAVVRRVHFVESACDKQNSADPSPSARALCYKCAHCEAMFASTKARDMHARVKHGAKSQYTALIASSTCPSCGVDFQTRARCLNHLGDRRRPRCAAYVVAHCKKLAPDVVAQLETIDREERRTFRRAGHSQVLASRPARDSNGRIVGRGQ